MELDQHLIKKLLCKCKTTLFMRTWVGIDNSACPKCLAKEYCDFCGKVIKAEEKVIKSMCGHIVHLQCHRSAYGVTRCVACLDGFFIYYLFNLLFYYSVFIDVSLPNGTVTYYKINRQYVKSKHDSTTPASILKHFTARGMTDRADEGLPMISFLHFGMIFDREINMNEPFYNLITLEPVFLTFKKEVKGKIF